MVQSLGPVIQCGFGLLLIAVIMDGSAVVKKDKANGGYIQRGDNVSPSPSQQSATTTARFASNCNKTFSTA